MVTVLVLLSLVDEQLQDWDAQSKALLSQSLEMLDPRDVRKEAREQRYVM